MVLKKYFGWGRWTFRRFWMTACIMRFLSRLATFLHFSPGRNLKIALIIEKNACLYTFSGIISSASYLTQLDDCFKPTLVFEAFNDTWIHLLPKRLSKNTHSKFKSLSWMMQFFLVGNLIEMLNALCNYDNKHILIFVIGNSTYFSSFKIFRYKILLCKKRN